MAQFRRVPVGTRGREAKRRQMLWALAGALFIFAFGVLLFVFLPLVLPPGISIP